MMQLEKKTITTCNSCNSMYKVSNSLIGKPVICTNCKNQFIVEDPDTRNKNTENESLFLCKIALNYGLINETQLQKILTEYTNQVSSETPSKIEDLLISQNILSAEDLVLLIDIRKNWKQRQVEKQFAADAVKRGLITSEKAREALVNQAIEFKQSRVLRPLGDFLLKTEDSPSKKEDAVSYDEKITMPPSPHIEDKFPEETQTEKILEANEPEAIKAPEIKPKPSLPEEKPIPVDNIQKEEITLTESMDQEPIETLSEETLQPEPQKTTPDVPPEAKTETLTEPEAIQEVKPLGEDILSEDHPSPLPLEPTDPAINEMDSNETRQEPDKQELVDDTRQDMPEENINNFETIINIKGLELVISKDNLIALLRAPKDELEITATVDDITATLREEEIIFGVVENALVKGFLNSKIFREKPFKIAEGTPPKDGSNGNINYFFDTDHLKIGALNDSGHIDFKNRGEIPHVNEGDLLAEITPAVIGQNGIDIYGRDLFVPAITEVSLRCEKGTKLSDDKTKVFATISGQPKLSIGNQISVLSELSIPGDVGFETGHIEFEGNIVVRGTIQSDFTVKGANITAKEILAANIEASGDLTVSDGITGAKINAQGSVKAKFINKAEIKAFGDIIAVREIIDTSIENSGACKIERGKIISSEIASKQGIEALEIGTEMSNPNKLKVGVDDHIAHEVEKIEAQVTSNKEKLLELRTKTDTLSEESKETQKKIADLAHIQDRSQLDQQKLKKGLEALKGSDSKDQIAELENKIEELASKAKEADESINSYFDRQDELSDILANMRAIEEDQQNAIKILKDEKSSLIKWSEKLKTSPYVKAKAIYAGTTIIGTHTSRILKETVRHSRIREVKSAESAEGWEMKIV